MKKSLLSLIVLASGLSQAQTLPTAIESVSMYSDTLNAHTTAISFWGDFKQSDCILNQAKLAVAAINQVNYNRKLINYFSVVPSSQVTQGQLNDYKAHIMFLNALNAMVKAVNLRCEGGTGETANLYYQIGILSMGLAEVSYEKRYLP